MQTHPFTAKREERKRERGSLLVIVVILTGVKSLFAEFKDATMLVGREAWMERLCFGITRDEEERRWRDCDIGEREREEQGRAPGRAVL